MRFFFYNWKILFIVGFMLAAFLVLLPFSLNKKQLISPSPSPSLNPLITVPVDEVNYIQNPIITNVDPLDQSILTPGESQVFSIEFTQPVSLPSIAVLLRSRDIIDGKEYMSVQFEQRLSQDGKNLLIRTLEPILPFYNYNLTIFEKSGIKLFQANYKSDREVRIKEPQNNLELTKYLPHTTTSYTLSYVPDRNLYVFSFNYDPSSSESLDSQYEKAKADAIKFIESKGISISSIVIEWRYR